MRPKFSGLLPSDLVKICLYEHHCDGTMTSPWRHHHITRNELWMMQSCNTNHNFPSAVHWQFFEYRVAILLKTSIYFKQYSRNLSESNDQKLQVQINPKCCNIPYNKAITSEISDQFISRIRFKIVCIKTLLSQKKLS